MQKWLKIVLANVVFLVFVVGGLGLLGFYVYNNNRYVSTEDARVSANTINITALTAGKIVTWDIHPGDQVDDNSVLGTQQPLGASNAIVGTKPTLATKVAEGTYAAPKTAAPPTSPTPSEIGKTPTKVDIKAPISGTIIQNIAEEGQTVVAGQPLAMIADLNKVYVVANIEETRINDIKPDQPVDITLDAFPGEMFSGRVRSITRATTSTFSMIPTGTTSGSYTKVVQKIPVQISIDNGGKEILPGMSASVRIEK